MNRPTSEDAALARRRGGTIAPLRRRPIATLDKCEFKCRKGMRLPSHVLAMHAFPLTQAGPTPRPARSRCAALARFTSLASSCQDQSLRGRTTHALDESGSSRRLRRGAVIDDRKTELARREDGSHREYGSTLATLARGSWVGRRTFESVLGRVTGSKWHFRCYAHCP